MTPHEPRPAFRLFRGRRIEIDVHLSLVLVMALVVVVMATSLLPESEGAGGREVHENWLIGAGCALLLLASVAVHEVAHALAELLRGRPVRRVSLVFLHSTHPPLPEKGTTPGGELLVAVAGPLATLALGLAALGLQALAPDGGLAEPLLEFLAVTNLLLAAVQAVPGHPLDGGRALRAVAWMLAGDPGVGTRWAARVSLAFSVVLGATCAAALPFMGIFSLPLWGLLMAFVLAMQSVGIARMARQKERLTGWHVGHVVEPLPEPLPRILSVGDALQQAAGRDASAFIVEFQGRLGGIVTLQALRGVPEDERHQTPVGQVTRKLQRQHLLDPSMALESAFERMRQEDLPLLPVLSSGNLLGVIRMESVARMLERGRRS